MAEPKTEFIKIENLNLLEKNPRTISKENFEILCDSIKSNPDYFWARPILANNVSGKNVVYAGNQRLKAAKKLGMKDVPCIIETLSVEKEKERTIRDNIELGEWDINLITNEWDTGELEKWGLEIPIVDVLPNEGLPDKDFVPEEPENIKTKPGDVYELGDHRLMCGDSTVLEDAKKLMNGEISGMIFTDPPYNIDYGVSKNPKHKIRTIKNDKQTIDEWIDFNKKLICIFKEFNAGDIYVWGAPGYDGMRQRILFCETGIHWSATIIWKKQQLVLSPAKYQRKYKPCFYGWFEKGKSSYSGDRKQTEVWDIDRPHNSKLHPTMKPIELCEKGINNSSEINDLVLDLFGGSGSTLIACERLKRKCRMMELDEKYCDVIVTRWLDYTGQTEFKLNGKTITSKEWET